MYYLIHTVYGLILAFAMLGYGLLYKTKTKLPICFFPITAISGITVCIYIFGLLGFLFPGCIIVVAGGLLCLFFYRSWEKSKEILTDWSILFCLFALVWLFLITRHSGLSQWDDFNHWYRICKAMNFDNTYPTTPDIRFYTYVPGTATWIYLVTRFIGFNVSNCFFAQNILHISCLACLFASIEKIDNKRIRLAGFFVIFLTTVLLYGINYSVYELLIDTLVALISLSALIITLDVKSYTEVAFPLFCVLSFLAIIKNSCILFIVVTLIVLGKKNFFSKRQWIGSFLLYFAIPFMLYRLYFVRASIYYVNNYSASQDASFRRFYALMREKGLNNIWNVTKKFIVHMLDIGNDAGVTVCFLWLLFFVFIYAFIKIFRSMLLDKYTNYIDGLANKIKQVLLAGIMIVILFSVALLFTYIFSMDTNEANKLACFWRYFGTITAYLIGAGVYIFLKEIIHLSYCRYGLVALCLLIIYTMGFYNLSYIGGYKYYKPIEGYNIDFWNAFQKNVAENKYYTEDSYLVLWFPNEYGGYANKSSRLRELAITWFRSTNIQVISNEDIAKGLDEKLLLSLSNYDYLVTLSDMSDELATLKDYLEIKDYHVGICSIGDGD